VDWLGEIPAHWEIRRLKHATAINSDTLPENTDPDYGLQYVDISNVDSRGNVLDIQEMPFEKAPSRARRQVRDGDTIISTIRTYLKAIAFVNDSPDNLIVSTGFAVLRPEPEIEPKYLWRLVQSQGFVDTVVAYSKGIGYPAIAPTKLADLPVWIPPLPEQRTIAAHLDRETAKLDALTRKQERLVVLLQEKRAALISHAVTQGLDPTVPMKDSGIPWLGEIPAHWEVGRVKFFTAILRGKFSHRPRNDPRFYDGPYPFIQTGDISAANKYITNYHQTLNELGFAISKQFPSGTLVMSIAANIGDLAILTFPACFPDSVVGLVPNPDVSADYLYYNLTSLNSEMLRTATQNTQFNLNIERIGQMLTVCPPLIEQRTIAAHLDRETAKLDALIDKAHEMIERLQEYRTALISAAVTGKIDVRRAG